MQQNRRISGSILPLLFAGPLWLLACNSSGGPSSDIVNEATDEQKTTSASQIKNILVKVTAVSVTTTGPSGLVTSTTTVPGSGNLDLVDLKNDIIGTLNDLNVTIPPAVPIGTVKVTIVAGASPVVTDSNSQQLCNAQFASPSNLQAPNAQSVITIDFNGLVVPPDAVPGSVFTFDGNTPIATTPDPSNEVCLVATDFTAIYKTPQ